MGTKLSESTTMEIGYRYLYTDYTTAPGLSSKAGVAASVTCSGLACQ